MIIFAYLDENEDKALFEKVYLSYRKQMLYEAQLFVKETSDAEDIVHSVFYLIAAKYWDKIKEIKDARDLRNYLLIATKNTALNYIKKNKKTISLDDPTLIDNDRIDISDDYFIDTVCSQNDYSAIVNVIREMDETYRDVLYYHFVLEMTVSQVAKNLRRPESTVKKQLVRGKKILLKKMGK